MKPPRPLPICVKRSSPGSAIGDQHIGTAVAVGVDVEELVGKSWVGPVKVTVGPPFRRIEMPIVG